MDDLFDGGGVHRSPQDNNTPCNSETQIFTNCQTEFLKRKFNSNQTDKDSRHCIVHFLHNHLHHYHISPQPSPPPPTLPHITTSIPTTSNTTTYHHIHHHHFHHYHKSPQPSPPPSSLPHITAAITTSTTAHYNNHHHHL